MAGGWRSELREWGKVLVMTVGIAIGLRAVVVEAFVVPTGSMKPTIVEGDHLLGSKFHYRFWHAKAGDVVVFRPPEEAAEISRQDVPRYVKRVIAIAGDEVEVTEGIVRVNGERLREPYVAEAPDYELSPTVVPPGHLFVLGDNRNDSLDSHRWGFLSEDSLIAHVFARYWPPHRIGGL